MQISMRYVLIGAMIGVVLLCARDVRAQDSVFDHSQTTPWWLSGQGNFIAEWHPRFHADYSGPNSFEHASEQAASYVLTLYSGLQLGDSTELVVDPEIAGGSGLSKVLGIAGFPNLDAIRNPELGSQPYLARAWLRQVIPLSDATEPAQRTPLSMLTELPDRRIDIHAGRFSLVDFFDSNSVAGDDHMQFMNWTVDDTGAYDYAADTHGYTYGGIIDYEDRLWGVRFAEALMPKRANGLNLEYDLNRAHSENFELEFRPEVIRGRTGAIRLLAFANEANMGDYRQAIAQFDAGQTPVPEITHHPRHATTKYGFMINLEQELTGSLRGFVRAGWNEGQHESFVYTEVDQTVTFGADLRGDAWSRPQDKVGVALVGNGISRRHREYLADGGLGFLLGDGNLTYGPEKIMETYYNFPVPVYRGFYAAVDLQYVDDPGYNRARGPVVIPGVRLHVEL
jgi:high affinity Mn2+ porin